MTIKHIGFGVNGFSMRDPFASVQSTTQISDTISTTAETVPAGETAPDATNVGRETIRSVSSGANPLNAVALEAACRAYARRWMPSDSPEFTRQAQVHVEYIIRSYLDMVRDCQAVDEFFAKAGSTSTVSTLSDDGLLRRSVRACRVLHGRSRAKHPRWVAVMWHFALGSTYARQLCQRFGLDPDEEVRR